MTNDDSEGSGGWLQGAVSEGRDVVREFTTFLGVKREKFVCPECNTGCVESMVYDSRRAAFDGGESPSWECPSCGRHFVREDGDEGLTLDLYGRE